MLLGVLDPTIQTGDLSEFSSSIASPSIALEILISGQILSRSRQLHLFQLFHKASVVDRNTARGSLSVVKAGLNKHNRDESSLSLHSENNEKGKSYRDKSRCYRFGGMAKPVDLSHDAFVLHILLLSSEQHVVTQKKQQT